MKPILLPVALLTTTLVAAPAFAHQDSCDVDIEYGVKISPQIITFYDNKKQVYRIENDQYLIVDGEHITLDDTEQRLVMDYSHNIRAMVPEVRNIAIDGVELAMNGINMAFTELLGEGNSTVTNLESEFINLRTEIDQHFAEGQTITFNYDDEDSFFESEFENRIEELVEDAVTESMGSLLVAVGQEMLLSGGDMDAFEQRMETFGEKMEQEMVFKAEGLEERADALCSKLENIVSIEQQMRDHIEPLADYQAIEVKSHKRGDRRM